MTNKKNSLDKTMRNSLERLRSAEGVSAIRSELLLLLTDANGCYEGALHRVVEDTACLNTAGARAATRALTAQRDTPERIAKLCSALVEARQVPTPPTKRERPIQSGNGMLIAAGLAPPSHSISTIERRLLRLVCADHFDEQQMSEEEEAEIVKWWKVEKRRTLPDF